MRHEARNPNRFFSCFVLLASCFLLLSSQNLFAFPDTERLPADPSTLTEPPLDLLNDQPEQILIDNNGEFGYFIVANDIIRVDLFSWSLATDQVPTFDDTPSDDETAADLAGEFRGVAGRGTRLYVTQDDGDMVIIDLEDITAAEPDVVRIVSGELGQVVADPEGTADDDLLYIADQTNKQIHVFDISENVVVRTITLSSGGGNLDPGELLFVAIAGDVDRLYVATDEGIVFSIIEGASTATALDIDSVGGNDLVALAASPNGDLLFVLDDTDDLLHVFNTADNTAVGLTDTPIDLIAANGELRDLTVLEVANPDDVYAFIAGTEGVSVIDLDISNGLGDFEFLDFGDDEDNTQEPFELADGRTPQQIFALSQTYLLTVNGDASLSVISENPFVTITANSLGDATLGVGGSFSLLFEADAAGTYSVRLGGDLDADGTELDSGDVATANTSVTTNTIAYSSSFAEGANNIFVFVTDADGNRGHDKVSITVDTPPPAVTLTSTGFGHTRAYINFDRLDVTDIASYSLYAETTAAGVLDAAATAKASVAQPASGTSIEGEITGLTNGQTYFLAVEAVDANGNVGPRNGTLSNGNLAVTEPQETIGITGASGEAGCSLVQSNRSHSYQFLWILCALLLLGYAREAGRFLAGAWPGSGGAPHEPLPAKKAAATEGSRRSFAPAKAMRVTAEGRSEEKPSRFPCVAIIFFIWLSSPQVASAVEASPQWFSFEFKFGEFIPNDVITRQFLTQCCNERLEAEFGFLWQSKYGLELGVGFLSEGRTAVGAGGGGASQDDFNFTVIPIQNNLTFRADFKENQLFVPYVKFGPDYWIFRENVQGRVTKGVKYGIHGTLGVQILMEFGDEGSDMELDWGINDVYLTLEGEYAYVNSFSNTGLDLSGWLISAGLLFEF